MHTVFCWGNLKERSFGRTRHRWRIILKGSEEAEWEGIDWASLA
jgi:hypothetical protein